MKQRSQHITNFLSPKRSANIFFTFLLLLLGSYAHARQLVITNAQNGHAIADVFYTYGTQQGLSDADGIIEIAYREGEQLQLTHLAYQALLLKDEEVQNALSKGYIELTPKAHTLEPVAIIQLRPNAGNAQQEDIGYVHQTTPDAGAYLGQLPGIATVKKSASYGFDPVLRGFQRERLLILIDGVQSAHEACPNRMDPPASQVALNSMSSVEVQKGPYSLRYGMGFGGIINFTSVKPRFSSAPKALGRLSAGYESNLGAFRSEGMAGITARAYDFRLFGAYARGQDYTDGEGTLIPADFNRLNLGAQLAVKAGKRQILTFSADHNRSENVDFAALPMDLRKDHTWLLKATHRVQIQQKQLQNWSSSAFATIVDHRMDNLLKPLDPRMMNAWVDAQTFTYGARTETQWSFDKTYLYAGADFKSEEAIGDRMREFLMGPMAGQTATDDAWQHGRITHTGLFAEWHLPAPRRGKGQTIFILSGRLDYNSATALKPSENFLELYSNTSTTQVNPGFSAGFNHSLNEQASLAVWLGRAQRSPGISERFIHFLAIGSDPYEMLGNPLLKPEKNNQMDVLFRWQTQRFAFRFNAFAGLMQDYISSQIREDLSPVLPNSPGVRQYINIDRALMAGFEVGFRQMTPAAGLQQVFNLSYTYGQNLVTQEALPEIPPLELRYRLSGSYLHDRLKPELSIRYAFAQEHIARSYGETATPAFYVIDLAVAWQSEKTGALRLGVNNLLDAAYYEHLSRSVRGDMVRPIYNPGRSFFAMYSIRF
ncbi:MAG TPA: TonB-dependent receptor [Phaeodactylibacter sp.]|nr:TonB-dependent receptor [Phaeodactylibacter sp.]